MCAVGDSLWVDEPVTFPTSELRSGALRRGPRARHGASSSSARGIAQLDEEGVVQVLRDEAMGIRRADARGGGPMQFEVAVHRLENRVRCSGRALDHRLHRGPRDRLASMPALRSMRGVTVLSTFRRCPAGRSSRVRIGCSVWRASSRAQAGPTGGRRTGLEENGLIRHGSRRGNALCCSKRTRTPEGREMLIILAIWVVLSIPLSVIVGLLHP